MTDLARKGVNTGTGLLQFGSGTQGVIYAISPFIETEHLPQEDLTYKEKRMSRSRISMARRALARLAVYKTKCERRIADIQANIAETEKQMWKLAKVVENQEEN